MDKYKFVESRDFTSKEIEYVKYAIVVLDKNKKTKAVQFFLKDSSCVFMPLDPESKLILGEKVDLSKIKFTMFSKDGSSTEYLVHDK